MSAPKNSQFARWMKQNVKTDEILMKSIRRAGDRGHANHGWLDSYHTFSFANYYDPAQVGFRSLRVINDDTVQGGGGFDTHPHRDMEIISYVLSDALRHRDSMGTEAVLKAGASSSKAGRDGSIPINQDADLYLAKLDPGNTPIHNLKPTRHSWVHVAEGEANVNGETLKGGDTISLSEESLVAINTTRPSQILVFDLN